MSEVRRAAAGLVRVRASERRAGRVARRQAPRDAEGQDGGAAGHHQGRHRDGRRWRTREWRRFARPTPPRTSPCAPCRMWLRATRTKTGTGTGAPGPWHRYWDQDQGTGAGAGTGADPGTWWVSAVRGRLVRHVLMPDAPHAPGRSAANDGVHRSVDPCHGSDAPSFLCRALVVSLCCVCAFMALSGCAVPPWHR